MSEDAVRDDIKRSLESIGFPWTESAAGIISTSFNSRTSFKNVNTWASVCKAAASKTGMRLEMSIAAFKKDIVVSARVGGKRRRENGPLAGGSLLDGCDDFHDRVDATIERINKSEKANTNSLTAYIQKAKDVLYRSEQLKSMDGCSERAVQSFGLFKKRLNGEEKYSLLLAIRLNTGTAIRLSDMIGVLGETWADGALTTEGRLDGVQGVELPMSEEAKVSMEHGNFPLLIITTIPSV